MLYLEKPLVQIKLTRRPFPILANQHSLVCFQSSKPNIDLFFRHILEVFLLFGATKLQSQCQTLLLHVEHSHRKYFSLSAHSLSVSEIHQSFAISI